MINPILESINSLLPGFNKLWCLLERHENKSVQYISGGRLKPVAYDNYAVGGYWRLRSKMEVTEKSHPTIACDVLRTFRYPMYFVAWFKRDQANMTIDDFATKIMGYIGSFRTQTTHVKLGSYETDKQEDESGKVRSKWSLVRIEVDIVVRLACSPTCENVLITSCPSICDLIGETNWENIKECMSEAQIEAAQQDLCSLCGLISESDWIEIKACMSAGQIQAAEDDLCSGGGLDVSIEANETEPTVGEDITVTVTALGADAFCIFLGNNDTRSGASNVANYAYLLPGIYNLSAAAFIRATGIGGGVPTASEEEVTVAGIAEAYSGYQFGPALFRLTSAQTNCVRLYRSASATYQDVGFGTDGWIDIDAVETFANGSQVFINKVYHPSDSSRDCAQATPANMPPLTDASGNIYLNTAGKPEWRATGSEFWTIPNYDYFPAGDTSLYCQFIGQPTDTGASNTIMSHYDSAINDRGYFFYIRNGDDWAGVWSNDGVNIQLRTCGAYIDVLQVFQMQIRMGEASADRLLGWYNGVSQSSANVTGNEGGHIHEPTSTDIVIMGSGTTAPSGGYTGTSSCILIFNDDLTGSQAALATNAGALIGLDI